MYFPENLIFPNWSLSMVYGEQQWTMRYALSQVKASVWVLDFSSCLFPHTFFALPWMPRGCLWGVYHLLPRLLDSGWGLQCKVLAETCMGAESQRRFALLGSCSFPGRGPITTAAVKRLLLQAPALSGIQKYHSLLLTSSGPGYQQPPLWLVSVFP